MQIERKITVFTLALLAVSASLAFAQVAPVRKATTGSAQSSQVAGGSFAALNSTPLQQCLMDLISWKQSLAHDKLGGSSLNWNTFSPEIKDARMEVIRACNLYHRATLTAEQQATYDRTILDPKGHPLPAKWEAMRLKGTLVKALLVSTPEQQKQATTVLNRFRDRNHQIWGHGHKNGGYAKNHGLLVKDFRAILTKAQLAEFNSLWGSYVRSVDAAVAASAAAP